MKDDLIERLEALGADPEFAETIGGTLRGAADRLAELESTVAGLREAIAELGAQESDFNPAWVWLTRGEGIVVSLHKASYPKFVAVALPTETKQ